MSEEEKKAIEEAKKYITSLDFFKLLYTEERKKEYFIAHDKLLNILEENNNE